VPAVGCRVPVFAPEAHQARIQLATENDSIKSVRIVMNRRHQVSTSQTFGYAGYFFFYWRFN
jgi:hypothetical protein